MQKFFVLLLICTGIFTHAFVKTRHNRISRAVFQAQAEDVEELDIGDFENVEFKKVQTVNDAIAKYSIKATIKSKQMNSYLEEYKNEMKARKVSFPGFRPGKLPPYVMGDVRRYVVCFGLENLIGSLCNINGLKLCDEEGADVQFGEDAYYQQIITEDARGFDFLKQRDSWKEGIDFNFGAQFFAVEESSEDGEFDDEDIPLELRNIVDSELANVVDTDAVVEESAPPS